MFLKKADGSLYKGRVWPGATVFPDWFHSNTQGYWNDEFAKFFNADTGVDIDALWIDMNEPSNFCEYPCKNPDAATVQDAPSFIAPSTFPKLASTKKAREEEEVVESPSKKRSRRIETTAKVDSREAIERQEVGTKKGVPGRDLINPSYKIQNENGILPMRTADTDLIHQGGWTEYDTHNLYVFVLA